MHRAFPERHPRPLGLPQILHSFAFLHVLTLPSISLLEVFSQIVYSPSHVWLFVILWTAGGQASLSLTIFQSLPKFMFIASVMLSSYLILWYPLLLLPSIFPSIRDFSNELSVCIRWPKYWSFSFSISPSSDYSGLISLKTDRFDLPVQGTCRSLLQHHNAKASILGILPSYGPTLTPVHDHWRIFP